MNAVLNRFDFPSFTSVLPWQFQYLTVLLRFRNHVNLIAVSKHHHHHNSDSEMLQLSIIIIIPL